MFSQSRSRRMALVSCLVFLILLSDCEMQRRGSQLVSWVYSVSFSLDNDVCRTVGCNDEAAVAAVRLVRSFSRCSSYEHCIMHHIEATADMTLTNGAITLFAPLPTLPMHYMTLLG
jgi:hypothetical protein